MVGRTVGHYRIVEQLGQGGMGEVYLAQDLRLGRKTALKFLPAALEEDETARKRLLREARAAAALDHPYICHIHEVGEVDGRSFIAMEYVPGVTLEDVITQGPMPPRDAINRVLEISEALQRAHEEGIIHRDLKPSNVMIDSSGHAKVLDFGIARRLRPGVSRAGNTMPTGFTATLTGEGITPGTPAYMAPEQIRGQEVDHRCDLFSLGVLFYELLTGEHPFRKDSPLETAAAILSKSVVPLLEHGESLPPCLKPVLSRLLEKAPEGRYSGAGELRTDLEECLERSTPTAEAGDTRVQSRWRRGLLITVGLLAVVSAAALLSPRLSEPPVEYGTAGRLSRFASVEGEAWDPEWSPDGTQVAFHEIRADEKVDLWICDASGRNLQNLTSDLPGSHARPVWSPDGRSLAFISDFDGQSLCTMSLEDRQVRRLTALQAWMYCRPQWVADGRIVYVDRLPDGKLHAFAIAPDGTGKRCLTLGLETVGVGYARLSPSGEFLLISENWLGDSRPLMLHLPSGQVHKLTKAGDLPKWDATGRYVYFGVGSGEFRNLWRTEVDSETGREVSEAEMIEATRNLNLVRYGVSADGSRIVARAQVTYSHLWLLPLDRLAMSDLSFARQVTSGETRDASPHFLHGAEKILYRSPRGPAGDLWTLDLEAESLQPQPFLLPASFASVSNPYPLPPQAEWVAFQSQVESGFSRPFGIRPDGTAVHPLGEGLEEVLEQEAIGSLFLSDCSADGSTMAFHIFRGAKGGEIAIGAFDPTSGRLISFELLLGVRGQQPSLSPDGRAIAFQSERLGTWDIFTMSVDPPGIPIPLANTPKRERIVGWAKDLSSIYYYIDQDTDHGLRCTVWRIPMGPDNRAAGEPRLWITLPPHVGLQGADFRGDLAVVSLSKREGGLWLLEFE